MKRDIRCRVPTSAAAMAAMRKGTTILGRFVKRSDGRKGTVAVDYRDGTVGVLFAGQEERHEVKNLQVLPG